MDARELLAQQVAKLDMDRSLANKSGMSDQEIRARALECAVRWLSSRTDALEAVGITDDEIKTLFWGFAQDFEAYIRDGVT